MKIKCKVYQGWWDKEGYVDPIKRVIGIDIFAWGFTISLIGFSVCFWLSERKVK
jgi:hypothetical protein